MALYHFRCRIISRKKGKNAIAAAAYRSGEMLTNKKTDKIYIYSRKQDVIYSEIFLPKNASSILKDRETLWNKVESTESRKDSQLSRELEISLLREINVKDNINLIKKFILDEIIPLGMIADLCIHDALASDKKRNLHCHIMLTLRHVEKDAFTKKALEWNKKNILIIWRKKWEKLVNSYLGNRGLSTRVSCKKGKNKIFPLRKRFFINPETKIEKNENTSIFSEEKLKNLS